MDRALTCRLVFAAVCGLISAVSTGASIAAEPESATHYQDSIRPMLVRLCGDCHSPGDRKNGVQFLQAETIADLDLARSVWHSVAEQLHNRTMPPPDKPQPTEEERLQLAIWIEATLRNSACNGGEFAGPITPRRLNRYEYERTIRDLIGVDFRASETFPTDGSGGEGFNNNGETLFLPPLLMERYLTAAGEVLDQAIVSQPLAASILSSDLLPPLEIGDSPSRSLAAGEVASALVTIYVASDYFAVVKTRADADSTGQLLLQVDGIDAERWEIKSGDKLADENHRTTINLSRGQHALTVRNVGQSPVELLQIDVDSPVRKLPAEQVGRHRRLMLHDPGDRPSDLRNGAREVLTKFSASAFRRPVTELEVDRLLSLYDRGTSRGDPYEEAVKLPLKAVLVSPHFLFRVEADAESTEPELINDHELAVRLSYFLWSSQPDDELTRIADAGRLNTSEELRRQVDRMLDDPRSVAFAEQFVGQWLGTHEVGARVAPSTETFKGEFTTELLLDMHDEPIYFFRHLVATDGSLLDLIDSDYAIINKRLAEHYGIGGDGKQTKLPDNPWTPDPKRGTGGPFEVVTLPDDHRGGVLGMGGVHMLTSYPDRTSPVLRGGWVLETLLGVRVPSPPPDVPQLKRSKKEKKSLREQLAQHRENPTCAACHNLMDPLGFALENFDALGRWRDKDGESEINASASLPAGEEFTGPAGLRAVLLARKTDFLRQATRKMLGYALGRSLEDADDCTVQRVSEDVAQQDYKVRGLVQGIVQSTPFRNRQAAAEQ